jgi:tetratricopeptide (TPR) repeat protein
MNATQQRSFSELTGDNGASDLSLASLQELAEEYPYFAPVQFFLASALSQSSQTAANAQAVKTALYFNNPHWLQFQLQQSFTKKEKVKSKEAVWQDTPVVEPTPILPDPEPVALPVEEEEIDEPVETEADIEPATATEAKISGMLSEQLADFRKPVAETDKLDIEREKERLHTIDYFASQGIRIDLSQIPQDKLTSHLRKFTDWLKQMKNPNPAQVDLGTSAEMENAVMEIAKTSNVTREVLTEAMAEVLVKQGQVDKAIQLFIKLSFINPEKSSYFAARIEQLKGII